MSGLKIKKNDIKTRLDGMVTRSRGAKAGLERVVYPLYQKFQRERFESEGASEGSPWQSLNSKYSQQKLKRFRSYPGGGRKMLIATSFLAGSVIGPGAHPFHGTKQHRKIFSDRSMKIYVEESGLNDEGKDFTYAHKVAEIRPFMTFSTEHIKEMKNAVRSFILRG